jgi:peptidoglycan-associated lipoprotein
MKFIFFFVTLLFICENKAQDSLILIAKEQGKKGNHTASIDYYNKALKLTNKRIDKSLIFYKIAVNYEHLNDFEKAIEYYNKSYNTLRVNRTVFLDIADLLRKDGKYEESTKYLKKYLRRGKDKLGAKKIISANKEAKRILEIPTNHQINLCKELSSPFFDFSPFYTNQEQTSLVITSSRMYKDSSVGVGLFYNFYHSTISNDKWNLPLAIDSTSKRSNNIGSITIDFKRKVAYYTKCKNGNCGIYYSFLEGDLMGESFPLIFEGIQSENVLFGHPSFSNELDILFFVSDLNDGYGGKDIWLSKYNKTTNSWSKPKNLGPNVNTEKDELFPYIASDSSLYFSSNGHLTIGGMDIYRATINSSGDSWSGVKNLGYPLNSSNDDFGIVLNHDLISGYLSSNRKGGLGFDDIYEFKLLDSSFIQIKDDTSDQKNDYLEGISQVVNAYECVNIPFSLSNIKMFPNPTNGIVSLQFESSLAEQITLLIFNNSGQLILSEEIFVESGVHIKQIDLKGTSPGFYNVILNYNCTTYYTGKLIIE